MAMTDYAWCHQRDTDGSIVDGAGNIHSLGELYSAVPRTLAGFPVGWDGDTQGTAEDTGQTTPYYAGFIRATGFEHFTIRGLTAGGIYRYKALYGKYNAGISFNQSVDVNHSNDVSIKSVAKTPMPDGHCMDAQGNEYSSFSAWVSADGGDYVEFTAQGSYIYLGHGSSGGLYLSTVGFKDMSSGPSGDLSMLFVG
jgi:hypothetical protein